MNLKIRPATLEEHKELVRLANSSIYTKDFSNQLMFSGPDAYRKGWITIALDGSKIVGMSCVRHKVRVPETMLYFVVIEPDYRSRGIGEELLGHVMQHGPHSKMALNVMKENERAIKFYKRLGFRVAGETMKGQALKMEREYSYAVLS